MYIKYSEPINNFKKQFYEDDIEITCILGYKNAITFRHTRSIYEAIYDYISKSEKIPHEYKNHILQRKEESIYIIAQLLCFRLPPRQATLLYLKFGTNFSPKDISEITGYTEYSMISNTIKIVTELLIKYLVYGNPLDIEDTSDLLDINYISTKLLKILNKNNIYRNSQLSDLTYDKFIKLHGAGDKRWYELVDYMWTKKISAKSINIDKDSEKNDFYNYTIKTLNKYSIDESIIDNHQEEILKLSKEFINLISTINEEMEDYRKAKCNHIDDDNNSSLVLDKETNIITCKICGAKFREVPNI